MKRWVSLGVVGLVSIMVMVAACAGPPPEEGSVPRRGVDRPCRPGCPPDALRPPPTIQHCKNAPPEMDCRRTAAVGQGSGN